MRGVLLTLLTLVMTSVSAQTQIHRCLQADGTITFQELPCPEPAQDSASNEPGVDDQDVSETAVPADGYADFVNPFDAPEDLAVTTDTESDEPVSQDRATCEKKSRDAIDAIDFEMRKGYTEEQGKQYLSDLLVLTKQLRACKQL